MHNAPSVSYPVGRCHLQAFALLLLALMGGMVLCGWWVQGGALAAGAAGALLWLGWIAWAVRSWRQSPMGRLHWDSHARLALADAPGLWRWQGAGDADLVDVQVERVIDAQACILLRLRGGLPQARWIWLERQRDPARWLDVRRALQSAGR